MADVDDDTCVPSASGARVPSAGHRRKTVGAALAHGMAIGKGVCVEEEAAKTHMHRHTMIQIRTGSLKAAVANRAICKA